MDEEALFQDLRATHAYLQAYQDEHQKTGYGCMQSGACCQVGLQIPMMECENLAREVLKRPLADQKKYIRKLKAALQDPSWNWGSSIGDKMCAFYDKGCTIYAARPSICRMYGVVLEVDDFCPRERLSNGKSFVYIQKDVDETMRDYYRTLDAYGRLHPERDRTVYMPVGVLSFLIPKEELRALRKRTAPKFWKFEKGYRAQFVPSYRRGAGLHTNVQIKFKIPARS